jgi:endonuclease/exonuclease/phosphatase family metal-dependent hydrolase
MKIKKTSTRKTVLLSLLALIIFILVILFFYLPRYLTRGVTVDPPPSENEELTIMSTNVRCYAPDDLLKKSLFYRMELIATDIAAVLPDIICFQEMQGLHYNYLEDVMPDYNSVMAFRDKSIIREGCAIFYRANRFEEIESGHFWLSETPDVQSKDWGSAHYRVCVYACLKDLNTGKEFIVFNTHLDHKSEEARIKGIEVVLDKIAALEGRPAFLMGDMNAHENTPTIQSTKESFDDAKKIAAVSDGNKYTYNNWGNPGGKSLVDYILISKGDATVSEYHVVNNSHNGIYSSDHCPIYIKTKIN